MKLPALLFAAALPLAMAVACGQKGALYLPPRNGTVVTRPAGANTPPVTPSVPATQPAGSTAQPTGSTPSDKTKTDDKSQPPN